MAFGGKAAGAGDVNTDGGLVGAELVEQLEGAI